MKKVSIFGRSVPLFAVLIVGLLVTGASAAVVGYLSNTVNAGGAVESPYDLQVRMPIVGWEGDRAGYWNESGWSDTVEFGTLYGGETFIIEYKMVNRANVKVLGDVQMEVMCSNGIDADDSDFESVLLRRMVPNYADSPIAFGVDQGSNGYRVLYTTDSDYTFNNAGETTYGNIEFVMKENAVGAYTISGKLIPVADAATP